MCLEEDQQLAKSLGVCMGVKLVRGAYLEHERGGAPARGVADPVHATYEDTCANYDA